MEKLVHNLRENRYRSATGMTIAREHGLTPNGNKMGGRWVLRDRAGEMIDFDQYRHDLAERHSFYLVTGQEQ